MSDRPVAQERSSYRDQRLSARHRLWGWDCPALDLDFLEYDGSEPIALIEYKHELAPLADPKHPGYRALRALGTRAGIPVFGCRYTDDFSAWTVTALNRVAKRLLPNPVTLTEADWVAFLHHLRTRPMPEKLRAMLNSLHPPTLP